MAHVPAQRPITSPGGEDQAGKPKGEKGALHLVEPDPGHTGAESAEARPARHSGRVSPQPKQAAPAAPARKPARHPAPTRTPRSAFRPVDLGYVALVGLLAAMLWLFVH